MISGQGIYNFDISSNDVDIVASSIEYVFGSFTK